MAANTHGLADGFMRGFSFVDRYYDKEEQKQRQQTLDDENRQYRKQEFGLRMDQFEDRTTRLDRQEERQTKLDAENADYRGRMLGLQEAQGQRSAEALRMQKEEQQRKRDLERIGSIYQRLAIGGDVSDDEMGVFENQSYQHLSPLHLANPAVGQSIQYLTDAANKGDLNNDDSVLKFANNPEALEAFNTLYATQINKGEGGKKRIAAVLPGFEPGTLVFDLQVEPENGKPYRAPMTVGRDSKGLDVMQVSLGDIAEQLAGYQQMAQITNTEEFRGRVKQYGQLHGWLPAGTSEWARLNDDAIYNKSDGQVRDIDGTSGGGKATTKQREYQEMLELGVPDSVARGVAYGTHKLISDPDSGSRVLVDLASGDVVGSFQPVDPNDQFGPVQWVSNTSKAPSAPTAQGQGGLELPVADIQKVMQANPGKDERWASAYLQYLREKGEY